jgi:hypothetical protein
MKNNNWQNVDVYIGGKKIGKIKPITNYRPQNAGINLVASIFKAIYNQIKKLFK